MQHPKTDIERLYMKRESAGRGLIQVELIYKTTTTALKKYLELTMDWMLQLVKKHVRNKRKNTLEFRKQ